MYDTEKLGGLLHRVFNSKDEGTDYQDFKTYVSKVFSRQGMPDPVMIHQLNELMVREADQLAKPIVDDVLGLFANIVREQPGNVVMHKIPENTNAKFVWTANGSDVDYIRLEAGSEVVATPRKMSTGIYYEPDSLAKGDVDSFNETIANIRDAKVKLYLDNIYKLMDTAIAQGDIPANNVKVGTGITIADYNKLASRIARLGGGKPVFFADSLLIEYLAMQQASDATLSNLLTDDVKSQLLSDLSITQIGRTVAIDLVNPFTDVSNSKTELPVNKGFMFAGALGGRKPFEIVEYGDMYQLSGMDIEDERIKVKIQQRASVALLHGQAVGVVEEEDTSKVSL